MRGGQSADRPSEPNVLLPLLLQPYHQQQGRLSRRYPPRAPPPPRVSAAVARVDGCVDGSDCHVSAAGEGTGMITVIVAYPATDILHR